MVTKEKQKILTVADRCDACNAQAFVIAKKESKELFFCGHHFAKHKEVVYNWSSEVIDERDFINKKSESST